MHACAPPHGAPTGTAKCGRVRVRCVMHPMCSRVSAARLAACVPPCTADAVYLFRDQLGAITKKDFVPYSERRRCAGAAHACALVPALTHESTMCSLCCGVGPHAGSAERGALPAAMLSAPAGWSRRCWRRCSSSSSRPRMPRVRANVCVQEHARTGECSSPWVAGWEDCVQLGQSVPVCNYTSTRTWPVRITHQPVHAAAAQPKGAHICPPLARSTRGACCCRPAGGLAGEVRAGPGLSPAAAGGDEGDGSGRDLLDLLPPGAKGRGRTAPAP